MPLPALFNTLKKRYQDASGERRALVHDASEAQSLAKRAIFAMHRDDRAEAERLLTRAGALLGSVEKRVHRYPELDQEGAHRAALEEYAEALLFAQYLSHRTFGRVEARVMEPLVFLGGLSDATGEIVRFAIRQATLGHFDEVAQARKTVEAAVGFLLELDATGALRQKIDQARKNLRQLEEIQYDISLKHRSL